MSTINSPSISITFQELGASAVERGERGVIALALKGAEHSPFKVFSVTNIPAEISEANKETIKEALKGYSHAPKCVKVYVMSNKEKTDSYVEMLKYFSTEQFNWLVCPSAEKDGKNEDIASWIKSQRDDNNMIKAVLTNIKADNEGIVNWSTKLVKNGKEIEPADTVSRIAGILAGTEITISATYAPLLDFDDCERMVRTDRDMAVGQGRLIAYWDGEKVKINRAVTSLVTTNEKKKDQFKKIKIVDAMDMIKMDIAKTIEDNYIGKYSNSYDNKCLLVTAINGYFKELIKDGVLGKGECEIDVDAQRVWLEKNGVETEKMNDLEIKQANTHTYVFIKAKLQILDAMEDVEVEISI